MKFHLIALCALAAACVVAANAKKSPPALPGTLVASFSEIIPAEGVSHDCTLRQIEGPPGFQRINCSTADGSYTSIGRLDTAELAYFFYVNWKPTCYLYKLSPSMINTSLPGNTFSGFEYSKRARINGKNGDVFRHNVGRFVNSITFEDGVPRLYTANALGNVHGYYHEVSPNKKSAMSEFAFPAACNASHADFGGYLSDVEWFALPAFMRQDWEDKVVASIAAKKNKKEKKASSMKDPAALIVADDEVARRRALAKPYPLKATVPPTAVDYSAFLTPVRDQGSCGGCWSFSTAALMELFYYRGLGVAAPKNTSGWLSMQSIIDCAHGYVPGAIIPAKGCFGGDPLVALSHVGANGIPWEADYPYDASNGHVCKLASTPTVVKPVKPGSQTVLQAGNVTQMEQAIAETGGVIGTINVIGSLLNYGGYTEVYSDPACTPGLAHAILLVGYGTTAAGQDYWIVKNSFGVNWGFGGFIRMAKGVNMCGIESLVNAAEPATVAP